MLFLDHYNTFVDKMKVEREDKNCLEFQRLQKVLVWRKGLSKHSKTHAKFNPLPHKGHNLKHFRKLITENIMNNVANASFSIMFSRLFGIFVVDNLHQFDFKRIRIKDVFSFKNPSKNASKPK